MTTQPQHPRLDQRRDAGFTLIEMTMVMVILGIVMSTLAMAIVVGAGLKAVADNYVKKIN